jgi:Leucine-rich repeat (LRR) protein
VSLKSLDISKNDLAKIDVNKFTDNVNLVFIDFSLNLLTNLTADLFDGLINLKTLDLTSNARLIQIDQDLLLGSPLLDDIKLEKCNLTQNVPTFPGIF